MHSAGQLKGAQFYVACGQITGMFFLVLPLNPSPPDTYLRNFLSIENSTWPLQRIITCLNMCLKDILTIDTVTGSGRGTPGPLVAIPGAYKATDVSFMSCLVSEARHADIKQPGVHVGIYWPPLLNYTIPGPAVWRG